jgi:hypothetical protein
VTAPTVPLSDLPALARQQLRDLQREATASAATASGVNKAHWLDLAERVKAVLDPQ